jgi:hypothetical protein
MEGEQPDTLFVDLYIQRVNLMIPFDDLPGQGRVAVHQCGEGLVDLIFRLTGHPQEFGLQVGKFFVKVAMRHNVHPNRPVI